MSRHGRGRAPRRIFISAGESRAPRAWRRERSAGPPSRPQAQHDRFHHAQEARVLVPSPVEYGVVPRCLSGTMARAHVRRGRELCARNRRGGQPENNGGRGHVLPLRPRGQGSHACRGDEGRADVRAGQPYVSSFKPVMTRSTASMVGRFRVDVVGHDLAAAQDDDAVHHLEDVVDVVGDEDAGMPASRAHCARSAARPAFPRRPGCWWARRG